MAEGYQWQRPEISPASTYLIEPIAIKRDELSSLPEEVYYHVHRATAKPAGSSKRMCSGLQRSQR
jgi:hypothetical protein